MTSKLKQREPITLQTFRVYGLRSSATFTLKTIQDNESDDLRPQDIADAVNLSDLLLDDND